MDPDDLRRKLRARVRDEALADPRVKELERWAVDRPDEEVAEAVELLMVGLDASRRGRWIVLRTIDDEFRDPGALLPHSERLALLRWIVRARPTDARIAQTLEELRAAPTFEACTAILGARFTEEGPSLENAHPILASAWRAATPAARPPGPVHRGEPEPLLGARSTVQVVLHLAERVAHLLAKSERKAFDRLVDLATSARAAGRPNAALEAAIASAPREGALGIARAACLEARAALSHDAMAGIAARPAAAKAVGLVLAADGENAVRELLVGLDDELRRLDVAQALETRKKAASRRIAAALHRGAVAGEVVLWLAELEKDRAGARALGLLVKDGRAWRWSEGSADDVLAAVPDAHFERAVMAAGGRTPSCSR